VTEASAAGGRLKLLKSIVKWAVGLVAVGFCIYAVAHYWQDFRNEARPDISELRLALGVVCIMASYLGQAVGWMLLMSGLGNRLRLYTALRAWCYSQVGKYVPGKVVAFLVRAKAAEEDGALPSKVFATCVLEILVSLVVASTVWLISLAIVPGASPLKGKFQLLSLVPLPFALAALHPRVINYFMGLYYRWRKMPESEVPRLTFAGMLKAGAAYFVAWSFYGLGGYFILTSVISLESTGPLTVLGITGAFLFSWAVGYMMLISPGGLGFREGALTFALGAWLTTGTGAVIAALARLCQSGTELILAGTFWLIHQVVSRRRKGSHPGAGNEPPAPEA
jgi:glycosyltransferase 2 family protein